jgi:hypothetical protein
VQLVLVDEIVEQRLVHFADRVPVGAVHLGVIETVFHDSPALVEHLRAEGLVIDFEVGGVGHLTRGLRRRRLRVRRRLGSGAASASAARTTAGGSRPAADACGERDRRGKEALGRPEVQRAPVAGEREARTSAERTAAAAAAATTCRVVRRRRRHACQLAALHVDDVVATGTVGCGARTATAATG